MTRLPYTPFMLDFENLEHLMDQVSKVADGFPPYNIEQLSDSELRISLAVAGYGEDDLDVSVEDNHLIIRGRSPVQNQEKRYIYRGIAGRGFQKSFMLASGMKVEGAFMDKGLLHINLLKVEPMRSITKIEITPPEKSLTLPHKTKESKK
ncbi:MAG: Hsp20 family protein [Alphaproteobacteria bacterium]